MIFFAKILLSGIVIAFASWLAGRKPILAGFMMALPLASMLGILFSYLEYRDMNKINQFAVSILVSVPLSLSFFIPFVLNKYFKFSFPVTYFLAVGCIFFAYLLHAAVFKFWGFKT